MKHMYMEHTLFQNSKYKKLDKTLYNLLEEKKLNTSWLMLLELVFQ